jgi:BCCT family betaine/carnitine transporter
MEGLIAGALLFGGGNAALSALQAGAIATGLPFTFVLLLMSVCLLIGLTKEHLTRQVSDDLSDKSREPSSIQ